MQKMYKVKGMTCGGCKASVEKSLLALENVNNVDVDLEKGEVLIKSDKDLSIEVLQNALSDKYKIAKKKKEPEIVANKQESELKQLFPLFLIFGYILTTAILLNKNEWKIENFMFDFMGLFYIVFSFFKFLDIRGFAMSFKMYDPLAKNISGYGNLYPFIELALGLLFLFRYQTEIALIATLLILGVTTIGVTKSLLDKKAIKCACLGSVLNLPMTKATFIENSIMILMAVFMLMN